MTYDNTGLFRLHLAVVLQAIRDFRANPQEQVCKSWLLEDGFFILESYEQPVVLEDWQRFVESGCDGDFSMVRK